MISVNRETALVPDDVSIYVAEPIKQEKPLGGKFLPRTECKHGAVSRLDSNGVSAQFGIPNGYNKKANLLLQQFGKNPSLIFVRHLKGRIA